MELRWLPFASEQLRADLNIGPNIFFYLIDRYEVVVIAVMHCKQSSYVINRAIRYALKNFFES